MKKLVCNFGDTFGDWTVIDNTPIIKRGHTYVTVQCRCGTIKSLTLSDLKRNRAISCKSCAAQKRGHIKEIHIGDIIKKWKVIDGPRVANSTVQFKIECTCGSGYSRWIQCSELLNPNKCFSCKKCAHKREEYLYPNQYGKLKRSALTRDIEFNVSLEYLWNLWKSQHNICAITGDTLDSIKDASLDRIDSLKGYVEGNVQWVTSRANISKHTMTMEELYDFCKKVLNHANQQPSTPLTKCEGSETNS